MEINWSGKANKKLIDLLNCIFLNKCPLCGHFHKVMDQNQAVSFHRIRKTLTKIHLAFCNDDLHLVCFLLNQHSRDRRSYLLLKAS